MWSLGLLMPHAPILVPEVASLAGTGKSKTISAIETARHSVLETNPDLMLVLNPHLRNINSLALINSSTFRGSLQKFGAGSASVSVDGAGEDGVALSQHIRSFFPVTDIRGDLFELDYGAVVPLIFTKMIFGYLPPMVLLNPLHLNYREAYDLGRHLRTFLSGKKWMLIASGDLSHRLENNSPAGYHPDGAILDRAVVNSLDISSPEPLFALSDPTIRNAGECGLRSVLVLEGLSMGHGIKLISYEAPFGVGYATAIWQEVQYAK